MTVSKTRVLLKLEKHIIEKADKCIAADAGRIQIMHEVYKTQKYIYEYKNVSALPKAEHLAMNIPQDDKQKPIRVIYAGAITANRGLDSLLIAASRYDNVQVIIVGDGPYIGQIKKLSNDKQMNCILWGKAKYTELYSIISQCDIGYVYYDSNNMNNIYSASNKVYEYISANVAIVANNNTNLIRIINDLGVGVAGDEISIALDHVIQNLSEYKEKSRSINIMEMEKEELNNLREYICAGV